MTATTNQISSNPFTVLKDRILWFDGDSSYTVESLRNKILEGDDDWIKCFVIDSNEFSVKRYSELTDSNTLKEKEVIDIPDEATFWNIPDKYINMDVKRFIFDKFGEELQNNKLSDLEIIRRRDRVLEELKLWESINGFDLLKTLIYIIDTFNENDIIWGTGRGSSCCSYILYLIGVHDVDSIKYELETTDFFRV